ncbi:MAG TPA: carbohydrate-binding domain-containing protein [Tissierellaceae bacterium]
MKKLAFILLVTFVLLVIGCSSNILDTSDIFSPEDFQTNYDEDKSTFIQLNSDTAFSDSKTVKISGNTITITDKGTYILSGNLGDGMIIVDAGKKDRVHLILDNVHISNKTSSPIYIKQSEKVFITLKENSTNTLSNGGTFITIDESNIDAVIFSKEDLTINGTGTLKINSPEGHGIVSKDSLILTGGTYEIISKYHGLSGKNSICIADADINIISGKDGIHSENKDDNSLGFIYIKNGTYNISSKGDGIAASSKLLIDDGTFKIVNDGENTSSAADEDDNNGSTSRKGIKSSGSIVINGGSFIINSVEDAIHSDASININGGSFQISTDDDGIHADDTIEISSGEININRCYEGIEGSKVKISGGIITLNAIDDGINAAGSDEKKDNSNGSIIISDGNIYIKAGGDGIDSNGTLTISGGLTVVCCPSTGDTSIIDFDVGGTIEGGYFLAVAHLACLKSLVNQNKVSSH